MNIFEKYKLHIYITNLWLEKMSILTLGYRALNHTISDIKGLTEIQSFEKIQEASMICQVDQMKDTAQVFR